MSMLFKKLNLKDQKEILILDSPKTFELELGKLQDVQIIRDPDAVNSVDFMLAFVKTTEEIQKLTGMIANKAPGDPVIWFAYPKKTSKKFSVEINRDSGWEALDEAGFRPVRQVAIDEDWSALRFRRIDQVGK